LTHYIYPRSVVAVKLFRAKNEWYIEIDGLLLPSTNSTHHSIFSRLTISLRSHHAWKLASLLLFIKPSQPIDKAIKVYIHVCIYTYNKLVVGAENIGGAGKAVFVCAGKVLPVL
jgi:hypothetical protein